MTKTITSSIVFAFFAFSSCWAGPKVILETSEGNITIELNDEKAPISTKNFLQYVDDEHYSNILFHRVINGFMIQAGGFRVADDGSVSRAQVRDTIQNEAKNGLKNERGTLAMARTSDPHSAAAQFFINHKDNSNLDHPSFDGWGYAVFGKVIDGMDVVDKIAGVSTGIKMIQGQPMKDVPSENIVIKSAKRVTEEGEAEATESSADEN
ncbi:MAG: peptidylprolyl isomerase [Verrucomicrobiota bacterium]